MQPPGLQAERAGGELGEGRLAGAVDAQQADAVIDVEPQLQLAEDRRAPVADRAALDPQERRGQGPLRRGQDEGRDMVLDCRVDDRQLRQHLEPRLRLGGLAGLGAETVDVALQVGAARVDLASAGLLQAQLLLELALERVVAAGIEGELAVLQVQDVVDRVVEQLAVVADDDGVAGILPKPRL